VTIATRPSSRASRTRASASPEWTSCGWPGALVLGPGAVDVILDLLARHGQGGGCGHENSRFTYHSSFCSRPRCRVRLETAGRLHHALERSRGSRHLQRPHHPRFHAPRDPLRTRVSRCRARRAASRPWPAGRGAGDLVRVLRDHGEGHAAPAYSWLTGPWAHPACTRAACSRHRRPRRRGCPTSVIRRHHWVTAPPPLRRPLQTRARRDARGPRPPSGGPRRRESLWWRHERLHRA